MFFFVHLFDEMQRKFKWVSLLRATQSTVFFDHLKLNKWTNVDELLALYVFMHRIFFFSFYVIREQFFLRLIN